MRTFILLLMFLVHAIHADDQLSTPAATTQDVPPTIMQNETIDTIFFAAFIHACQTNSVNVMRAVAPMPDWDTTFTSKTNQTTLIKRLINIYHRLNEQHEEKPTITISSTTVFNTHAVTTTQENQEIAQQDTPSADESSQNSLLEITLKDAIKVQAENPNTKAMVQCTQQTNDIGSTIMCTATCNLKTFKQLVTTYNQ